MTENCKGNHPTISYSLPNLSAFANLTLHQQIIRCLPIDEKCGKRLAHLLVTYFARDYIDPVVLRNISSGVAAVYPRGLIAYMLEDWQTKPAVFKPLKRRVVHLEIDYCNSTRTTGKLGKLRLNSLLSFFLSNCRKPLTVVKSDFADNCMLRSVSFSDVHLPSIESGTFTNLPNLGFLSFNKTGNFLRLSCKGKGLEAVVAKLHCDCEYRWYRDFLASNPTLIDPANLTEVYGFGDFKGIKSRDLIYSPIDCRTPVFDQSDRPSPEIDYTINNPCQ